jgi:hypothetical protein
MDERKPRFPIRRFDVFADYHRIRNEQNGMPEDLAKGRGIWAAKVVAGRRYGSVPQGTSAKSGKSADTVREPEAEPDDSFRSIGGVPQTDGTFDKEIIQRMGPEFYQQTFHPAIEEAVNQGKRYEEIRDAIRKDWK